MKMTIEDLKKFMKENNVLIPMLTAPKHYENVCHELRDDEDLKYVCFAKDDKIDGVIIVTNKRMAFIKSTFLAGISAISIDIDKINSVTKHKRFLKWELEVFDNSGSVRYSIIGDIDILEKAILSAKDSANKPSNISNNISVADELLKFKSLLDAGVLTQEEFDKKKKELLG